MTPDKVYIFWSIGACKVVALRYLGAASPSSTYTAGIPGWGTLSFVTASLVPILTGIEARAPYLLIILVGLGIASSGVADYFDCALVSPVAKKLICFLNLTRSILYLALS